MAVTVSFDGTRVNEAEVNTNWGNYNATGGLPAAEPEIAYQNTNAVNKKVNRTATPPWGVEYNPGSGAVNMLASGTKLKCWFVKAIATDSFDLATASEGAEVVIGSASGQDYEIPVARNAARISTYEEWRAQGGYLLTPIAARAADEYALTTNGTPDMTAVDYFAFGCMFVSGAAKAENVALDAIDIGQGLSIIGTPVGDSDMFNYALDYDQDTVANRYGVVYGQQGNITCNGILSLGDSTGTTATTFTDQNTIVVFPECYADSDTLGIYVYNNNTSDNITINSLLIGEGQRSLVNSRVIERRPSLRVLGTVGTVSIGGQFRNFNEFEMDSSVTCDGAQIEARNILLNSGTITNSTITTNDSSASATVLFNPGGTPNITNTDFIQSGTGHAVELDSATTYNFNNLTFTGYGATTSDSAAIYFSKATGTTTVNLSNTPEPTYKTAGTTVNFVSSVTVTLTGMDSATEVRIFEDGTTTVYDTGTELVGATGQYAFAATPSDIIDIRIFHRLYDPADIIGYTVPGVNASLPISQNFDRNYENP